MAEQAQERKPSRKERELQFRVNLVLDAAEEVFADSAFAKASVEDIAERAEISVGTLYNLFRSKEDLYRAVVSRSQSMFFDVADQRIREARGARGKVHAAVSAFLEHFNRYTKHIRLYASASNGFQWELKSKLSDEAIQRQLEFRKRLADICQQGMDEGIFKRGIPAELLAMNIVAVPHAFLATVLESDSGDMLSLVPHALAVVDRILGTDAD